MVVNVMMCHPDAHPLRDRSIVCPGGWCQGPSLGIVLFRRKLPLRGKQLLPGGVNIQLVNAYPLREVGPPCLNAWELRRLFSATELMLHSPLLPFAESCFHHASADASPKNSPNKCPEHEFPSQSLFSGEQH